MKILQYATKESKKMFKDLPIGAYFKGNFDMIYIKIADHEIISENTWEHIFNVIDENGDLNLVKEEEIVKHLTGLSIIEL